MVSSSSSLSGVLGADGVPGMEGGEGAGGGKSSSALRYSDEDSLVLRRPLITGFVNVSDNMI